MEKLLQDLESQVSCSVCVEFLRTPKILPCFHAFFLQCLNRIVAHHAGDGKFKCPACRATTLIPQPEGTFDWCASSFLHNRLLDLLAIKEARNTPTLCGNCGKTASDCSYCFECGKMFCSVCLQSHNQGPRATLRLGDTISDSILEGEGEHKTLFLTNSL